MAHPPRPPGAPRRRPRKPPRKGPGPWTPVGLDAQEFRSGCPIASTLDLVGDRWSLVILRDMVMGKKRFAALLDGPERITTNVLADRLAKLERAGLIAAGLYQARPKRYEYELTPAGLGLLGVMQAICRWAGAHLPERWAPPDAFMRPLEQPEQER